MPPWTDSILMGRVSRRSRSCSSSRGFPVDAIEMPDDDRGRFSALETGEEPLVGGPCSVLVGGDGFVDELDRVGVSELGGQGGAVSALLFDGGVLAGAVDRDA